MEEHHIRFSFNGRYYSDGGSEDKGVLKEIWFVLHGQGQLAQYFLQKFNCISSENRRIIAPEGLSRYYLDGFYGRVGATWMTKEDRLTDISNYIVFLDSIFKREVPKSQNIRITLLGFSQGAATACRWILSDKIKIDRLILWAGLFPPDLDFEKGQEKLRNLDILNIYGDEDKYLTEEREAEQFQLAEKLGVELNTIRFHGGHELHTDTLLGII